MSPTSPPTSKAITIKGPIGQPGKVYYDLNVSTIELPNPSPTQLLVTLHAASLNHRDLFIRQHLYPGISFTAPLGSDGVGTVTSFHSPSSSSPSFPPGARILLSPATGWTSDPRGPEIDAPSGAATRGFAILGGTKGYANGTLQQRTVVETAEVEAAPGHLSDAEAAALPLTGLTAWRAVVTKGGLGEGKTEGKGKGKKVLITGIGGGVALMALAFATKLGAEVWVSSGSAEKIERAKELGARGGVSYKEEGWEKQLVEMAGGELDVVIDGAGGDIAAKAVRFLRPGGLIVNYGMTTGPVTAFPMSATLKNLEFRGTTMGSRAEFRDMVRFVAEHQVRPVVSRIVSVDVGALGEAAGDERDDGKAETELGKIEGLFEDMKKGKQFGKLVVEMRREKEKENENEDRGADKDQGSKL